MTASVAQLWRYPVKSMAGEQVPELVVGSGSVVGDRARGFVEADTGRLVSAKRYGALLECRARSTAAGVEVTFPDGTVLSDAGALSRRASVGSYAEVVSPGVVHVGDRVRVERVEPRHGVLTAALDAVAR